LSAGGRVLAEAEGPGANIATLPLAAVERRLTALLAQLGAADPDACCAGAAGAEVPARRRRLEQLLERLLPGSRVAVVHDARLVLAAAGLEEGIVVIAGTGSVGYGRTAGGREVQLGGWGWLLGDEGGGAWITREAAREVMRRADAGEPLGPMGESLLAACRAHDARELTARLHSLREPMRWAALAGVVFEAADRDAGAAEVVERAAAALGALAGSVRGAIGIDGPVVLAGGLLLNQARLESSLRKLLDAPSWRLEEPPVAGAVRLAEALIGA
jgi:glucosamine kinase